MSLGRVNVLLVTADHESALLRDTPIDLRVKLKRTVTTGAVAAMHVTAALNDLTLHLGSSDYKDFEVRSVLDCHCPYR